MKRANIGNKFVSNTEGVSPVIGVILMVAVTVILAAVIAAFVFGFAGNMPKAPKVAYVDVQRDADGLKLTNVQGLVTLSGVSVVIGEGSTAVTLDGSEATVVCYDNGGVVITAADGALNAALSQLNGYATIDSTVAPANCHVTISGSIDGAPIQVIEEMNI